MQHDIFGFTAKLLGDPKRLLKHDIFGFTAKLLGGIPSTKLGDFYIMTFSGLPQSLQGGFQTQKLRTFTARHFRVYGKVFRGGSKHKTWGLLQHDIFGFTAKLLGDPKHKSWGLLKHDIFEFTVKPLWRILSTKFGDF